MFNNPGNFKIENMNRLNPISVLIADDDAFIRQGLQMILGRMPNIHVVGQAKDGLEAVKQALDQKPDVILMDLEMPHMNGLDAAQKIHHKNSSIKIIMFSSLEKSEYIQKARQVGVSDYLMKGATPQEIIEAIHTVAPETEPTPVFSLSITDKYKL